MVLRRVRLMRFHLALGGVKPIRRGVCSRVCCTFPSVRQMASALSRILDLDTDVRFSPTTHWQQIPDDTCSSGVSYSSAIPGSSFSVAFEGRQDSVDIGRY